MRILIAFDADKTAAKHEAVLRGEQKLIGAFAGFCEVATAEWNIAGGKGIDDLLVDGGTFRRLDRTPNPTLRARVPYPCPEPGQVDGGPALGEVAAETSVRIGRRFTSSYRDTRAILGPPPGVGKTALVLAHQARSKLPVLWAVSSHKQGEELVHRAEGEICPCDVPRSTCAQHRFALHHDYGRNPDNCLDYEVVDAAQQNGYGAVIGEFICGTPGQPICPFRFSACSYYPQFDRPGAHVAPFEAVINRPTGVGNTKAVVIDDLDSSRLVARRHVGAEMLERALRSRLPDGMAALLRLLSQSMGAATGDGSFHWDAYQLLDDMARQQGTTLDAVLAEIPGGRRLVPERTVEAYRAAPPGALVDLIAVLHEELPLFLSGDIFTSGLRVHASGIDVFTLNLPAEDSQGRTAFSAKAVTLLTATPDPISRQWLRATGGEMTAEYSPRVAFPKEVKVVQDTGAFYGKTTASGTSRATIIQKAIAYIAEFEPKRPAVVTHKALCDDITAALAIPRERVLHFGNQRGSNDIRDADLLLVIGTPAMDHGEAYTLACAAYRGEGPPPSARMVLKSASYGGWRDTAGRGRAVDVLTFADERVAEVYETSRRDELIQAIYRMRPFDVRTSGDWRTSATVVLITEFPVAGLRVDDLRMSGNAGKSEEARSRMREELDQMVGRSEPVTSRALAVGAGTSKNRAAEFLREVSAPCTPTSVNTYIEVGVQTAETLVAAADAVTTPAYPSHWQPCPGRCGVRMPPGQKCAECSEIAVAAWKAAASKKGPAGVQR